MLLIFNARQLKLIQPVVHHHLSELLVVESTIGQKCCGNKNIPNKSTDLSLERLTTLFPSRSFRGKTIQKADAAVDFELNTRHFGLDGLCLTNKRCVLSFVRSNTSF